MGLDGFHPWVPLDHTDECCERLLSMLDEMEMAGKWPTNASTTLYFLMPKSITSERPIALLPTLVK